VIREATLSHWNTTEKQGQGLCSWHSLIPPARHGQVAALRFTGSVTSLLRNHLEKQTNDLSQKSNTMIGYDITQNKSPLVIPVAAFASRSKAIFIEARPIPVRTPRNLPPNSH
jgi:hypothetical protein